MQTFLFNIAEIPLLGNHHSNESTSYFGVIYRLHQKSSPLLPPNALLYLNQE
jgi:hypothetical protein